MKKKLLLLKTTPTCSEQSGPQKEVCKTILEERCDKVLEEVPEQVCEKIPVRDCSGPAPNYRSADGSGVTLLELKEKCGQNTSDLTPSCSEVLEEECRTMYVGAVCFSFLHCLVFPGSFYFWLFKYLNTLDHVHASMKYPSTELLQTSFLFFQN